MNELLRRLSQLGEPSLENLIHVVDILLVGYLFYRLLLVIRGTRTWRVLGGLVMFVIALFLSDYLHLTTLNWILEKATLLAPVALVILLLPELRQTLEGFAKLGLWPERLPGEERPTTAQTVEEVVAAVSEMAQARIGMIVVLERGPRLDGIATNGVILDAQVSASLLGSVFYHGNPLHDGAVLIRGDRIVAAACRLPLSENPRLDPSVHMRHRAAVGVSEQTDCLVVVVSEERGSISVARDGRLARVPGSSELREILNRDLRGAEPREKSKGRRSKVRPRISTAPATEPSDQREAVEAEVA